jgi:DnaK suppressor protein
MPAAPRSRAAHFPVRPGEEPWTGEELAQLRAELEAEAAGLRADIARAASDIAERLTDAVPDAGDDQADAGTKASEREHELALTQNAQDLLDQGERALARIDAGTYGVCESCGQPIGKARLQAFPRATLCVMCKQREERR